MRIGILTLPLHVNYGGILQAYALQTVLERMGHQVEVINTRRLDMFYRPPLWKLPLTYGKRMVKKVLIDRKTVIRREVKARHEYITISQHTRTFIDKYIHNHYVLSPSDIQEGDFDAIVVGSDQVWRPRYFPKAWGEDKTNAFLAFAKGWDIRRVAYAVSFGVDEWEFPKEHEEEYAALARLFDAVSVREDTGIALCRDHLGVTAEHVLDPTMLLGPDDYMTLVNAANIPADNRDMFCYILDRNKDKMSLVDTIAREHGLKPFQMFDGMGMRDAPLLERVQPPVEAWLRSFADARFVVTDSFHGCVFSVIFGKPFVAIGNVGRGLSRMESLMRLFGLEDHLLTSVSRYDPANVYDQPDEVRRRLDGMRTKSRVFLSKLNTTE